MKPSQIKETCESEHKYQKVKIVCLSLFMAGVATTYGGYFDNLVFRSGMYQQHALAGNVSQVNFVNKVVALHLDNNIDDPFYKATADWHGSNQFADETWEGEERRKYEDWIKMHNMNTIWFDTSACLEGPHIGEVNLPNSGKYDKVNTWKASYQNLAITDNFNWANEDMYRDFRRSVLETIEDCDVDCQAKGSQLTLIAGLLGLVYFLVGLNALFMFIGTWRYRWRVCSVYFTGVLCLFQFCVLVSTGALLFTKYNGICSKSMRATSVWDEAFIWTMADDFYMTFSLWVASFFTMIGFVCCSHQQIRPMKDM